VVFLDDVLPDADAVLFLTDAGTALTCGCRKRLTYHATC
jgi:hypothetical protein